MDYMNRNGVAHRDFKLENILFDEDLNLKVVDFGFATNKNIKKLNSYIGTKTYMAPEIHRGLKYNGQKIDMFSIGVILWILVVGNFPFTEATLKDTYYSTLVNNTPDAYFKKVGGDKCSPEFKDLIRLMLSYFP